MNRSKGPAALNRRAFLGAAGALPLAANLTSAGAARRAPRPAMVGSQNALAGMKLWWPKLVEGTAPLDCALGVVQIVEADPNDSSVGLGGLPNEDGVVQLDAACMNGPTHNSGAVGCLENILHPSAVARLVMERTDHCLLVGRGAYQFARMHGHPHVELLTEKARGAWLAWKESMSLRDDRLPPAQPKEQKNGGVWRGAEVGADGVPRTWGTIHCSALSPAAEVACTTTTSGLSWKIPGRVGDSPIVGAGLYCDMEAGSAGATGRGEAAVLANGSFACVELMRHGAAPLDAGLEVLRRIVRQVGRQAKWQPELLGADGLPDFNLNFYLLAMDGRWAGVTLKGGGHFAVSDPDGGPRLEPLVSLLG
jgi:N4-(beta-N-acetylglucosaminyl)-L-asparaginase